VSHGPITRLMSPGDLGERLKPFVFLDRISVPAGAELQGGGFGWHPHSGIATITVAYRGAGWYEDSTGKSGTLEAGSVEWMRAGGGVWHTGGPREARDGEAGRGGVAGFQLWLALPPSLELAEPESMYVDAAAVPQVGPARVILGRHESATSPIAPVTDLNYLQITLAAGERFTYRPPAGHRVCWIAICTGALRVAGTTLGVELAVFDASDAPVSIEAEVPTEFVLGSAVPHPHPLVLGYYSVHTSPSALAEGEAGIRALQERLSAAGLLKRAAGA
jgi:redox-sensitive bicupin YhaK (pirin superfamily)